MLRDFAVKFDLALKALNLSRARLASQLGVDKTVVGRWARGSVRPSAENMVRLTDLVRQAIPGFTSLDWQRDIPEVAAALGVDPKPSGAAARRTGSTFHDALLAEAMDLTSRRGGAYEGFFRSTRPFASQPGRFLHDQMMVRRDDEGALRYDLRCDRVRVTGWVLPQQNLVYTIGAEDASGSLAFGIFNGSASARADVIEGLMLSCALEAMLTPIACAVVFERVGDLTGDLAADDARLDESGRLSPVASPGSVSEAMAAHLVRDIGPLQLLQGGDWLLRMPQARSVSRGAGVDHGPNHFASAFPPDSQAAVVELSSRRRH